MQFTIDASALNTEERYEFAKMLFKCGYSIRLEKRKEGSKVHYYIVCKNGMEL